jgi:S-adenosylmethionine decarboxylase
MVLLAESHLALHTFPEHESLTLNLFCCRPREEWDFAEGLARHVGAAEVRVRRVEREYGALAVRHASVHER